MTNLLGDHQTITTDKRVIYLHESQFIGEKGYVRGFVSKPKLGRTSTGGVNYKQPAMEYPVHNFKWNIVMPEEETYFLVSDIENQILKYKNNAARDIEPFLLKDNKLGIIRGASPGRYQKETIEGDWVFNTWPILFTSIEFEQFGNQKMMVSANAVELTTNFTPTVVVPI